MNANVPQSIAGAERPSAGGSSGPVAAGAALATSIAICFAAAAFGAWVTGSGLRDWYPTLDKPAWNPPNWVFGPVWTLLYLAMGVAAWLVWRRRGFAQGAGPLLLFAVQLALNAAWSGLFFGLRSPGAALVEIVVLWLAIVATLISFWRVSRAAGGLLVPYLAWVSFAAILNAALWQLNR